MAYGCSVCGDIGQRRALADWWASQEPEYNTYTSLFDLLCQTKEFNSLV